MSKPIKTTILRDPGDLLSEEQDKQERLSSEDLKIKVQQHEDVLLDLERRREQIERQKRQLEELRRKQHEFEQGQHEIQENLTRGLVLLERQEFELKREAEQVQIIREQFATQLQTVEAIQAQEWETDNLEDELTRALATVDQAKSIYSQAQVRMEAIKRQSNNTVNESLQVELTGNSPDAMTDFWSRVAAGLAYSLPGLIGLFLLSLFWLAVRK
jgi:chromosome segregation ATPase